MHKKRGLIISEVALENAKILAFKLKKVGSSSVTQAIKEINTPLRGYKGWCGYS